MTPKAVMDNALLGAVGNDEGLPRIIHWRPGLLKISKAEESGFYTGLNLRGKDFRSLDEINRHMQSLVAGGRPMPKVTPETPFDKAQALVYETIDAPGKKRIEKARQALAIYPGCADAWVILSEYEKAPNARKKMLEDAVRAGEIALRDAGMTTAGSKDPKQNRDRHAFWSTEARPYMRARLALAQLSHEAGESEKAICDYRSMLELNPTDNQGIRYLLLSALLATGSDTANAEAGALVGRVRDGSAAWAYAQAYLVFKREGDTAASMHAVTRAYYANPLVPKALLGEIHVPKRLPETYEYGKEDEAVVYAASALVYWSATSGALAWLSAAADRITIGLPTPFGANTSSVRHRIDDLWRVTRLARTPSRDRYLAKALSAHPEFGAIWATSSVFEDEAFVIGGANPIHHAVVHAAIEEILDTREARDARDTQDDRDAQDMRDGQSKSTAVSEAMRATLDSLTHVGLSRHEAVHLLEFVWVLDWMQAASDVRPVDSEALIAHMRYVSRMASGEVSPEAVLTTPSRNDPCPCGSGRKFKKCCGRTEMWPLQHVIALAMEIKAGHGKVRSRGGLGLSPILGEGKYAAFDELAALPEGHPLVVLENTSVVAKDLMELGREYQAYTALRDNVELARTLAGEDYLVVALTDAIECFLGKMGYGGDLSQYACELARLVDDPSEASRIWGIAAEEYMFLGEMLRAGEALDRAMSTGIPHPLSELTRARFLVKSDRHDEAALAYRQAIKDLDLSTNVKYLEMAEQARAELMRLGRTTARIGKKT